MSLRYLSVCSGIEAATAAWHPLGWEPVAFSEVDAFPSAVLNHHYPTVPNWGDMTTFQEWPDADVDVLVGGTPCQSFSVAGLRKGLADPRGNLMLTYLAIAGRYRPRWLVWENVPGILSSNGGRDFAALLGGLAELGYGFAYRVLDAQHFGVAQRRRRVFVVGHLGGWQRSAAVLFERSSLSWHPAPRREAGQETAGTLEAGAGTRGHDEQRTYAVAPTLSSRRTAGGGLGINTTCDEGQTMVAHSLRAEGFDASHANGGVMPAVAIGLDEEQNAMIDGIGCLKARREGGGFEGTVMTPHMAVRLLTPRECERLQGFPDDYTLVPYRNKPAADGPRYKALGNSMAVPVMRWIGERIAQVETI